LFSNGKVTEVGLIFKYFESKVTIPGRTSASFNFCSYSSSNSYGHEELNSKFFPSNILPANDK